jgi:phosphatidylglycerophosphatase A
MNKSKSKNKMKKKVWLIMATFFYVGYLPIAPGTWASMVTAVLVYFIRPYWQATLYIQLIVIFAIFLLGIPAASYAEKHFKKKDPRPCVIDEVAGQMVSLLLVPHKIVFYVAAFFLFRFFDIIKPPPIKPLEKAPHGIGIMIDDIAAGLFALGVLHLGIYIFERFF